MEKFVKRLVEKAELSKSDSDFAFFFNLLILGEAVTKIVSMTSVSALNEDKDRQQYRVLHSLVRANGIGDWSKSLDDVLTGTASQFLDPKFREHQAELTKKAKEGEWQFDSVKLLIDSMEELGITVSDHTVKKDLRSWFRMFTELRNKTRGHGATITDKASKAAVHLSDSINLILENLSLLTLPTAYVKRNLSGKYRVSAISNKIEQFEILKSDSSYNLVDGIYVFIGEFRKISLITSDPDLSDFYISNGGFSTKKYELISYYTDNKASGDSSDYLLPKGQLPPSESEGSGGLVAYDKCFSNVPSLSYEYINRPEIEDELFSLLMDDRRVVVTLLGRGGIGKTSLALRVIPRLYDEDRYDLIIWFSSRDVDLQASGPKLVNADVISIKDIAKYYCAYVLSDGELKEKSFDHIAYFQKQLNKSDSGSCLFVFDNFETTESPVEIYKWIDTFVRLPNKILITTRLRDFKGDYPLTVKGMNSDEANQLIQMTSKLFGANDKLSATIVNEIYEVSAGHPYIIKILVGEYIHQGLKGSLPKILASSDEVLTALFERTFSALNPCTQRVFLTVSSWNSMIPKTILMSVLMSTIGEALEVERSVETLLQYSMLEEITSEIDNENFIVMPYVARAFGDKKLKVNPLKPQIKADKNILLKFGVVKAGDKKMALSSHIERFLAGLTKNDNNIMFYIDLIKRICSSYNSARLIYIRWLLELREKGDLEEAKEQLLLYLENVINKNKSKDAWYILSQVYKDLGDSFGEAHALIEISQIYDISFQELSNFANRINFMLGKNILIVDNHSTKHELLIKLFDSMCKRKNEASSLDLSRMAWLAFHLNNEDEARELTRLGLEANSDDIYCQNLMKKFTES